MLPTILDQEWTLQDWAVTDPDKKFRMGVVPIAQRSVQGPKSHTIYNFNPWANVEARDIADMLSITVKQGCACNGNQKSLPLFALEADILSGKIIPEWAGQFGSPTIKKGE